MNKGVASRSINYKYEKSEVVIPHVLSNLTVQSFIGEISQADSLEIEPQYFISFIEYIFKLKLNTKHLANIPTPWISSPYML